MKFTSCANAFDSEGTMAKSALIPSPRGLYVPLVEDTNYFSNKKQ